jgi:putative transposase
MRPPKVDEVDYIQFLIAAQKVFTCCEASRCQPCQNEVIAHDAFTRLLARQPPDTAALWQEVEPLVDKASGMLVLDDTTLDKPYARRIELVTRHWSGKHRCVVLGINLLTLLWTDGRAALPCDCRLYDKPLNGGNTKGHTKNVHFQAMLTVAKARGFTPALVCFDSWYASLENLKLVRALGWHFLTRLKSNRLVNPDGNGNVAVETLASVPPEGVLVHLKGFGFVRLFRTVAPNGDAEHWVTSQPTMSEAERAEGERRAFGIETYHRGVKQCCAVERCQCRSAIKQRGHIHLALRAFVRLEVHRLSTGISWYEAKWDIVREAIRAYLARPTIHLSGSA